MEYKTTSKKKIEIISMLQENLSFLKIKIKLLEYGCLITILSNILYWNQNSLSYEWNAFEIAIHGNMMICTAKSRRIQIILQKCNHILFLIEILSAKINGRLQYNITCFYVIEKKKKLNK